jgi:hypothetical protein
VRKKCGIFHEAIIENQLRMLKRYLLAAMGNFENAETTVPNILKNNRLFQKNMATL